MKGVSFRQEAFVSERLPNPLHTQTPILLERLTPPAVVLPCSLMPPYPGYVVLKNGNESLPARWGDLEAIDKRLFGDCPAFIRDYAIATRRDWNRFGDMVSAYNELCSFEAVTP